ncbi:MAG: hypothetical protein K0S65_841 [Labilithrix sp.]|jgi:hypothetical protein|nr:hypothetical protein [Labilithrix sp.]
MKLELIVVSGVLSTLVFGCVSGGPVPADKLARSEAAVRGAQEIGAERNPEGARHLQAARSAFSEGKKLVIEGDQQRATALLLRAEADAELSMNVTREATAIAEAQRTREEIRNLRISMKGGN